MFCLFQRVPAPSPLRNRLPLFCTRNWQGPVPTTVWTTGAQSRPTGCPACHLTRSQLLSTPSTPKCRSSRLPITSTPTRLPPPLLIMLTRLVCCSQCCGKVLQVKLPEDKIPRGQNIKSKHHRTKHQI